MNVFEQFLVTFIIASLASLGVFFIALRFGYTSQPIRVVRTPGNYSERWVDWIFAAQLSVFIFVFAALALLRYLTFHMGYLDVNTSWDLAQYDQIIWNSLNGRLFENTFILDARTFLGKSFAPILAAFVPLYAVWPTPMVLLVVQVVAVASSAIPLYWFARAQIGRGLGLVLSMAFFLSPGVENIVLAEFHEIALAMPLLAFAMLFLLRKNYRGMIVLLAVALLVKEEIAFIVIAFGLYVWFIHRQWKWGISLTLFGIAWGVTLLQFIIPSLRGAEFGSAFYYFGQGAIGGGGTRYGYLGQNVSQIALTLLTRPDIIAANAMTPAKLEYLLHLLVPLTFLPLIGFEVAALTLPTLGYSLLSTYALQTSIRSYYFAPLLPFLFFGAAVGLRRVLNWGNRIWWMPDSRIRNYAARMSLVALVGGSSLVNYFFEAPGPFGGDYQAWRYEFGERTALGHQLLALIPLNQTVIAQNEYLAHLSHEPKIYEVPIPDYRDVDYAFADSQSGWYDVHSGHWEFIRKIGFFETVAEQDGYWIGKQITPQQSFQISFRDELVALGYALPITAAIKGGSVVRPVVFWRTEKSLAAKYKMNISIVDAQGHVWAEQDVEPHDGTLPTDRWERGKIIADQYALRLPPTMPTGEYHLMAGVHPIDHEEFLEAFDATLTSLGTQPTLARLRVEKNTASFTASDLVKEQPLVELFVDMGEVRFLGYYPIQDAIHRGNPLPIGVYWRARAKPRGDYLVVVQLRDANGRVAFEQSARPAAGSYSTLLWSEGEVVLDWHDLNPPLDLALGRYQIITLLRDALTDVTLGEAELGAIQVVP